MGTKLRIGLNAIAELTEIGGMDIAQDTIEVSTLDSSWRQLRLIDCWYGTDVLHRIPFATYGTMGFLGGCYEIHNRRFDGRRDQL